MVYPNRVVLNINQKYVMPIPYTQQGDTARVLTFNILDKGVPFSLTGKTVRAKILKPDNTKCYNDLTITNATNGECTLNLTNQILAVAGKVNCQLEIKEGEELLSTIIFSIDVEPSIDISGAAESTNEFTALLNGIIKLDEWDKYFKETSGAIEEKYTERLNGIDSSLEDVKTNVKYLNVYYTPEMFGAKGDGITDDTKAVQQAIDYAGINGTVILPKKDNFYKISAPIELKYKGLKIIGNNHLGNTTCGFICSGSMTNAFEISEDYIHLEDIYINCNNNCNVGLYGVNTVKSNSRIFLKNINIANALEISFDLQIYLSVIQLCNSYRSKGKGFYIHGTSTIENTCIQMTSCFSGESLEQGFVFDSITYSNVSCLGSDYNDIAYEIKGCKNFSLDNIGVEHSKDQVIFTGNNSWYVTINGITVVGGENTTASDSVIDCKATVSNLKISGVYKTSNNKTYFLKLTGTENSVFLLDDSIPHSKIYYGTNNEMWGNVRRLGCAVVNNGLSSKNLLNNPPSNVGQLLYGSGSLYVGRGTTSNNDWIKIGTI